MASFPPDYPKANHEAAIQQLTRGSELMPQLQSLVLRSPPPPQPGSHPERAKALLVQVSQCFARALSALKDDKGLRPDQHGVAAGSERTSNSSDDGGRKNRSSEKRKKPKPGRDGREQPKRRKCLQRKKITPAPYDDGFQWRKYGQKEIYGSKFPRNYFRCTYRNEQGCQATKQVQQTDDDPSMFQVMYNNSEHTCKLEHTNPHVIIDSHLGEAGFYNLCSFSSDYYYLETQKKENSGPHPIIMSPGDRLQLGGVAAESSTSTETTPAVQQQSSSGNVVSDAADTHFDDASDQSPDMDFLLDWMSEYFLSP